MPSEKGDEGLFPCGGLRHTLYLSRPYALA
jgi:hypothetical protein